MKHSPSKSKNVYVVQLDDAVLGNTSFVEENPSYIAGKPCVYVGRTGRAPDERFEQHRTGYKACRFVRRFGLRLRPDLYAHFNPMTYGESVHMEVELATNLRRKGYGVWQR